MDTAKDILQRITANPPGRLIKVMNVCGGHERTISMAGLRSAVPGNIQLIPGPGCPVCVCPEEDIYAAIRLAQRDDVILVAFGDMLRVPANVPRAEPRSLEQARAAGSDVRPIASPVEAAKIAADNPDKQVVFFAAGFETTMAPVAAMIAEKTPENLSVLLSGRLTWPAVAMLLESEAPGFDALVAPGHVATVMGPQEWAFVPRDHGIPAAVAGFTPQSILRALETVVTQVENGTAELENCYELVARPGGNATAQQMFALIMEIYDANWRGIGIIPGSGFKLNAAFAEKDARVRFDIDDDDLRKRAGEMPPGCDCARVVLGKIAPTECRLFGAGCNPRKPVGPCMVSDEGACRIWWAAGVREPVKAEATSVQITTA